MCGYHLIFKGRINSLRSTQEPLSTAAKTEHAYCNYTYTRIIIIIKCLLFSMAFAITDLAISKIDEIIL